MKNAAKMLSLTLAVVLASCGTQAPQSESSGTGTLGALSVGATQTRYIVDLRGDRVSDALSRRVTALGGQIERAVPGAGFVVVTGLSQEGARQLRSGAEVVSVIPDEEIQGLDPVREAQLEESSAEAAVAQAAFASRQWHHKVIGVEQVRAALGGNVGSKAVTVAILDSGVDPRHPDLVGLVDEKRSTSFVPTDDALVKQYFPNDNRPNWTDLNGHGTHVASTVSSNGVLTGGVTNKTTIMAVKVLGARGSSYQSSVLQGIVYAADNGADVINMSLGGTFNRRDASASGGDGPSYLAVVNKAINYAARKGVTIVVSAGNSATDMDHDGNSYKAYCSAPNVICVSATGPTDSGPLSGPNAFSTWTPDVDALAIYSNFGRSVINVAAPGGNYAATTVGAYVWQACSTSRLTYVAATGTFNKHICTTGNRAAGYLGTSMASPHVAGLAALMVEKVGKNPAKVRAAIEQSADDLGQPGTDPAYGKGRINVARALGLQ